MWLFSYQLIFTSITFFGPRKISVKKAKIKTTFEGERDHWGMVKWFPQGLTAQKRQVQNKNSSLMTLNAALFERCLWDWEPRNFPWKHFNSVLLQEVTRSSLPQTYWVTGFLLLSGAKGNARNFYPFSSSTKWWHVCSSYQRNETMRPSGTGYRFYTAWSSYN